jgi:hypothetical protein
MPASFKNDKNKRLLILSLSTINIILSFRKKLLSIYCCMKIRLTHRKLPDISMLIILLCLIFLFASQDLSAQYSYNKYLSVEKDKKAKSFIDLLFKVNKPKKLKQVKLHKQTSKVEEAKVKNDTNQAKNRIESLRDGGDIFYLYIVLADHESRIKITVYNMLGKKVLDVYEGYPLPNGVPHEIYIDGPPALPNGVYLCVVVGKNFRLREKFVVSRR